MTQYDVNNKDSLKALNTFLATNNFIGGAHPNGQDSLVYAQFQGNAPSVIEYPNVTGWFYVLRYFTQEVKDHWVAEDEKKQQKKASPKKSPKKKEEKKPVVDDDDADLFGDEETGEEKEARLKREEEARKKKQDDKKKKVVIQKSLVIIDIKVFEMEQNLDELAKKVIAIELDGLTWKTEYKIMDVAFGMKKLRIGMVVEDAKISVDDINEKILAWEDEVQSVDIVSFDKC